jgi:protein phosphatase
MAGGKVDQENDTIDGNPFLNVSRTFGHKSYKDNDILSPLKQKLTSEPSVFSWRMAPGDIVIIANHSVYETRGIEPSSVDAIADLVLHVLRRGGSCSEAAAALCDFAVSFGSTHNLCAQVMRVPDGPTNSAIANADDQKKALEEQQQKGDGASSQGQLHQGVTLPPPMVAETLVYPGTLYPSALRTNACYRDAVMHDVGARLGLRGGLAEFLEMRYERVKNHLPHRYDLPTAGAFPAESGMLSAVMCDEADFFGEGPTDEVLRQLKDFGSTTQSFRRLWFEKKAELKGF